MSNIPMQCHIRASSFQLPHYLNVGPVEVVTSLDRLMCESLLSETPRIRTFPLDTRRCCDVESTSMTLNQCPVSWLLRRVCWNARFPAIIIWKYSVHIIPQNRDRSRFSNDYQAKLAVLKGIGYPELRKLTINLKSNVSGAVQSQKAVYAHLTSENIPPFGFAERIGHCCACPIKPSCPHYTRNNRQLARMIVMHDMSQIEE